MTAWNSTNYEFTLVCKHSLHKGEQSPSVIISQSFHLFDPFFLESTGIPVLWIVKEKEGGGVCVAARCWGQEKKRAKGGEPEQGEAARAEKTEYIKENYA